MFVRRRKSMKMERWKSQEERVRKSQTAKREKESGALVRLYKEPLYFFFSYLFKKSFEITIKL